MTDPAAKPRRGCVFYGCITGLVLLVLVLGGLMVGLHYVRKKVNQYTETGPLELTADDINALIASGSDQQALKGKFYVSLDGDKLKGEVSVPLQQIGLSMFKGRYLNGNATFSLSFRNGALSVSPQTFNVKGKPLPETYMREIRKQNLAEGFTSETNAVAVLQGLADIQVKDGKLVVVPKEKK